MTRAVNNQDSTSNCAVSSNRRSSGSGFHYQSNVRMSSTHAKRRGRAIRLGIAAGSSFALVVFATIAGCQGTLMPLAVQWGADLISAASQNYSKTYSNEVQNLLLAMYHKKFSTVEPYQRVEGNEPAPDTNGAPNYADTYESGPVRNHRRPNNPRSTAPVPLARRSCSTRRFWCSALASAVLTAWIRFPFRMVKLCTTAVPIRVGVMQ